MRRIKLVLAVAAAMVVLMMAAAPAMADISFGNNHHSGNNVRFGNLGNGLFIFSSTSGLVGNDGDIDVNGVNGFDVDFD